MIRVLEILVVRILMIIIPIIIVVMVLIVVIATITAELPLGHELIAMAAAAANVMEAGAASSDSLLRTSENCLNIPYSSPMYNPLYNPL